MARITATPAFSPRPPRAAITTAPIIELRQHPQTDCDGAGVLTCPTGTCYTGGNGFIGCCTVSDCVVRTTCIPFSSTASVDCDQDTGGCQRCTNPAAGECVTLTNTLMDQYALYCSTVSLFSEIGYSNLITTGSTAPMPSSNPFTTTSSSSHTTTRSTSSSSTLHTPSSTSTPNSSPGSQVPLIVGVTVSCSTLLLILLLVGCVVHRKYVEISRWPHFICGGSGKKSRRRISIENDEFKSHRSLPLTDPCTGGSYRVSEVHGESTPDQIAELGGSEAESDWRGGTKYTRGYAAVPTHSPHNSRTVDDAKSPPPWSPSAVVSDTVTPQQSTDLGAPRNSGSGLFISNPSPPTPPSPNHTMGSEYSTPDFSSNQRPRTSAPISPSRALHFWDSYGDAIQRNWLTTSYASYGGEGQIRLSSGGSPGYVTPENAMAGLGLQSRDEPEGQVRSSTAERRPATSQDN